LAEEKEIIFHQDNAPAQKSVLAMGKLRDLQYELFEHPPYFPDLAPSDLSFQNSNCSSLGRVFLRIKRRLQL
jgi:transposase